MHNEHACATGLRERSWIPLLTSEGLVASEGDVELAVAGQGENLPDGGGEGHVALHTVYIRDNTAVVNCIRIGLQQVVELYLGPGPVNQAYVLAVSFIANKVKKTLKMQSQTRIK